MASEKLFLVFQGVLAVANCSLFLLSIVEIEAGKDIKELGKDRMALS